MNICQLVNSTEETARCDYLSVGAVTSETLQSQEFPHIGYALGARVGFSSNISITSVHEIAKVAEITKENYASGVLSDDKTAWIPDLHEISSNFFSANFKVASSIKLQAPSLALEIVQQPIQGRVSGNLMGDRRPIHPPPM
ncbi:hypothetical protein HK100_012504 [Physocladia obscura]|uniref:Velvet domain-containing protein n=1 Tax=Physocladia obscura TaxID=109957 RepID=A0AAD5T2A1_9FUNG|nr:hypothetical protein HK100_012504 [Physocladia obscura]